MTFREVDGRLNRAVLREPTTSADTVDDDADESEADALGKRNAWMRKAMSETDLLPNVVETALGIVGGPFLGDTQIDAIVQLVEMSQKNIAEAVTDPRNQRTASTHAFGGLKQAYGGVGRGVAVAKDRIVAKSEENKIKNRQQKEEKQKAKELQRELKTEREMFKNQRQQSAPSIASSSKQPEEDKGGENESISNNNDDDEESVAPSKRFVSPVPAPLPALQRSTTTAASRTQTRTPHANVAYAQVGTASTSATTTFVPWEGLVISSTIVASPMPSRSNDTAVQRQDSNSSSSSLAAASISPADEVRLRSRKPPPVPTRARKDTDEEASEQTAHHPPSSSSSSGGGGSGGGGGGHGMGIGTETGPANDARRSRTPMRDEATPDDEPYVTSRQLDDGDGPPDAVVDVTDVKRKNWKSRLF